MWAAARRVKIRGVLTISPRFQKMFHHELPLKISVLLSSPAFKEDGALKMP
jgi:hypothetical protein